MSRKITRGARQHLLDVVSNLARARAAEERRRQHERLLSDCRRQISLAILGTTLTTDGPGARSSSYQLASVHEGIRRDLARRSS